MHTTSRTRRVLASATGAAFALSMLVACAESSADDPGTQTDEPAQTQTDDTGNSAEDWDRRLDELDEYSDKKSQQPYVGDPWERRLREQSD